MNTSTAINIKGSLLDIAQPIVMGILNITPDSFYDGGKHNKGQHLHQAEKMLSQGATILDIGGMSSRPGAKIIDTTSEKKRVIPVIRDIIQHFPETVLSIDTVYSETVRAAIGEGAGIINDISAGAIDANMYPTVAEFGVPYVLMHMKGTPENMQQQTKYDDVVIEILDFFIREIALLRDAGVKDIIIDLGFGFGKNIAQNYEILRRMNEFKILELPILTGVSRKSMIYKQLNTTPEHALNGTTALQMIALEKGTKILRVHDVKEAMECVQLHKALHQVAE